MATGQVFWLYLIGCRLREIGVQGRQTVCLCRVVAHAGACALIRARLLLGSESAVGHVLN